MGCTFSSLHLTMFCAAFSYHEWKWEIAQPLGGNRLKWFWMSPDCAILWLEAWTFDPSAYLFSFPTGTWALVSAQCEKRRKGTSRHPPSHAMTLSDKSNAWDFCVCSAAFFVKHGNSCGCSLASGGGAENRTLKINLEIFAFHTNILCHHQITLSSTRRMRHASVICRDDFVGNRRNFRDKDAEGTAGGYSRNCLHLLQ